MRHTVRLHVGQETVDVEMQQGARSWTASHAVATGHLHDTVRSALLDLPRIPWLPRPSVVVSIGSHASRVKVLRGLPHMSGNKALESMVRENSARFFLWNVPFVTTSLSPLSHDEAVGAILDASVVETVADACRETGYIVRVVHPVEDTRLTFTPVQSGDVDTNVSRVRATTSILACLIAVLIVLLAPALMAKRTVRRAERELATLTRTEAHFEEVIRDEQRNAAILRGVSDFEHDRRSATMLLAALTDALPPESALVTVRSDSTGVDLVVVSTRAAGVLGALDRVPGIVTPEIIGPISKELVGAREVERATIHFKFDPTSGENSRVPYAIDRQEER